MKGPASREGTFWRPELDVLRFSAFCGVFVHHALPRRQTDFMALGTHEWVAGFLAVLGNAGAWGVDVFFCLSAYLITELLRRENETRGRIDILAFWARRSLRIWPLYFVFIAIAVWIVPHVMEGNALPHVHLLAFLLFVGNWACALYGYPPSVAAPLWSVSIEEQFYIAWPVLLLLVGFRRRAVVTLLGTLILLAVGTRVVLVLYGTGHPGIWCNTLARTDAIALGALASVALAGRVPSFSGRTRGVLLALAIGGFLSAAAYGGLDGPGVLWTYPLAAAASGALLMAFLGYEVQPGRVTGGLKLLGRLSYGLYVFHLLALALVSSWLPDLGMATRAAVAFALTVALSGLSWIVLEQPVLVHKRAFSRIR